MNNIILSTESLCKYFGGLKAVDKLDLQLLEGEILGLIGPNGAGKTTVINLISGLLFPTSGKIIFKGKEIQNLPAHFRVNLGIARTFQVVRPFSNMSVMENVLIALGRPFYSRFFKSLNLATNHAAIKEAESVLEITGLLKLKNTLARTLPIGLLRRLEIARALALCPTVLLLDEPAAGLIKQELDELVSIIKFIHQQGITIMLVEHRMKFVMSLCNRIVVLNQGKKLAEGAPLDVMANPLVIEAYLGRRENNDAAS